MIVLGVESSCDETGLASVRHGSAACCPMRCTPRSRCTRSTAAWCRNWRRATTSGARCRCCEQVLAEAGVRLRDVDAVAYTAGPGPGRRAAGRRRRSPAPRRWRSDKPVLGVHHLEGHLLSPLLAQRAAGISVRRAAGLGRPYAADAGRRRRPLHAARRNARRRRRRSLRQVGQAAGPRLSGRPGALATGRVRRSAAPTSCRGRCCTRRTSTSVSPA